MREANPAWAVALLLVSFILLGSAALGVRPIALLETIPRAYRRRRFERRLAAGKAVERRATPRLRRLVTAK
jgi:hypothetical protein